MAASSTPRKSAPRKTTPAAARNGATATNGNGAAPRTGELYRYTTPSGYVIELPSLADLKFGLVRKIRRNSEAEQMFQLVEELCDDDALAQLDDLTQTEFADFANGWREFSNIDVGESSAS